MRRWLLGGLVFSFLGPCTGLALDLTQRSISNSRQFIVYCPDIRLRMAVTGFVETTKSAVLETLGMRDHWKLPIVINLERPSTAEAVRSLSQVRLFTSEEGAKVQIDVALREDQFKEVRFPQQVIRAILLEIAYRDRALGNGEMFLEPPPWLIEGLSEQLQARATGSEPNAALFKQLIETGRIPAIAEFLGSRVDSMDSPSRTIYGACASSLLEMLAGLPEGRASLALMIRKLSQSDGDPTALLLQSFPSLGGSTASLEKWWTLGLAHFSASDRYLALDVRETDKRITPLLTLQIVTDEKKGTKQSFALADYRQFIKFRTATAALSAQASALAALGPKTHPLLRPVVLEYQRIADDLARKKTHGIDKSLRAVENYRAMIVGRMDKIADYLNWFEATQMPEQSGAFDSYLKAATAFDEAATPKRNDAISRYIDQVENEFK